MNINTSAMRKALQTPKKPISRDVEVRDGISYQVNEYETTGTEQLAREEYVVNKAYYDKEIERAEQILENTQTKIEEEIEKLQELKNKCND